jgi:alkanesulfonate monooxygenase SsuD/methylene tetrahydromethanopterin reductase-like flavin-dependent oxidoreductase (luciferase family)
MPMEEADSRFDESMAVITKAFTNDTRWSHQGQYWQFDNVVVEPPTAQRPHPPFWMGAGSDRSVRQVAEHGYHMLLGQHDLAEEVLRWVALYRREVEAAGRRYDPMQVGVARAVHFADTPEELEAAYVRRFQGHLRINRLAERPGDDRARFAEHNEAAIRHHCDETAVFGTTDQICRKLEALRAGGVEYVIVNFGGSRQNIRRFARDVMPAFADTRPVAVAAK